MNCGNAETDRFQFLHDPGPDGLDPQASETPVGIEQDQVRLARTRRKTNFITCCFKRKPLFITSNKININVIFSANRR
jgi:hypothetical protein